jgi:hypothetical protein
MRVVARMVVSDAEASFLLVKRATVVRVLLEDTRTHKVTSYYPHSNPPLVHLFPRTGLVMRGD